jgi:hypothetical protein
LATGYGGLIDSTRSGLKADDLATKGSEMAQKALDGIVAEIKNRDTASSAPAAPTTKTYTKPDGQTISDEEAYAALDPQYKQGKEGTLEGFLAQPNRRHVLDEKKWELSVGGNPTNQQRADHYEETGAYTAKQAADLRGKSCIVATEAIAQGRVSADWLPVAQEYYRQRMPRDDIQVYWAWAATIVGAMRKYPAVARGVSRILPGTLTAMAITLGRATRAPLHGHFFFGLYKLLNYVFRPIVIRRNGKRLSKAAADRLFKDRSIFRFLKKEVKQHG